jgi:hypothetical protein
MQAHREALTEPQSSERRTGSDHLTEPSTSAMPGYLPRIAGILYLLVIVGGAFATGYVPAALVVSGNAVATAHNIVAHEELYRLSLAVHIFILLCNIPLAVIFYDLFKRVNRRVAMLVAFFLLVGTAIEAATLLSQFEPLILLGNGHYLSVVAAAQLQAEAYTSLELQAIGFNICLVFFGCYCLSIGYLIFRSTFLPRLLGVLLVIGGLCYLMYSFASFIAPAFASGLVPYIQLPSGIAEVSLTLWLLIAGLKFHGEPSPLKS